MKLLNTFLSTLLLASAAFGANAQTVKHSSSRRAHNAAHQELLAGSKSRIDKTVISDIVSEDVIAREHIADLSYESSKLIDDLLEEGRSHIGKRYVHGAKGPNAFDCSGFTSYVYKQFGYNISPGSRIQYTQGTPVARNELRKGDLVFFTSPRSGKEVGHVGIVVSADNETGNFKFIHASIRGVKISDFEGYYVPRYVGAKRIILK